jgi:hypothetical protein
MPITQAQQTAAEHQQWQAAQDPSPQVRLVAGPGTGKSARAMDRSAHGARPAFLMPELLSVAAGIGLAAACGFRVFVPLLALGLAGRFGVLPLSHGFEWLKSTEAIVAFSVSTLLEAAAYKIPWLDHALDTLATPAALFAGVLSVAALTAGLPPALRFSLALIVGGGAAAVVQQGATVLLRLKPQRSPAGSGIRSSPFSSWVRRSPRRCSRFSRRWSPCGSCSCSAVGSSCGSPVASSHAGRTD